MIPRLTELAPVTSTTRAFLAELARAGFTGDLAADGAARVVGSTDNSTDGAIDAATTDGSYDAVVFTIPALQKKLLIATERAEAAKERKEEAAGKPKADSAACDEDPEETERMNAAQAAKLQAEIEKVRPKKLKPEGKNDPSWSVICTTRQCLRAPAHRFRTIATSTPGVGWTTALRSRLRASRPRHSRAR